MADPKTGTGSGRWLRLALFVSLALNLAVVGVVAGRFLGDGPPHRGPRGADEVVAPYTRALEDHQRRALAGTLRQEVGKRTGRGAELLADYRSAVTLLRAEPFDPAAMAEVLASQARHAATRQQAGQEVLTRFLSGLSPTERQAYADRLEAQIARFEERRARWQRDAPGGRP